MAKTTFEMSITSPALVALGWNPETPVVIDEYDDMDEAIAAGQFKDRAAYSRAANATRRVAIGNRTARAMLKENPNTTAAELAAAINAGTYGERSVGSGAGAGPKKAELKAKLDTTKSALAGAKVKSDGSVTLSAEKVAELQALGLM